MNLVVKEKPNFHFAIGLRQPRNLYIRYLPASIFYCRPQLPTECHHPSYSSSPILPNPPSADSIALRMTLLQVFGPTADLEIGDGYMGWDEWDDGLRKLYVASRVEMMDAFPLGSAEESLFVMVMVHIRDCLEVLVSKYDDFGFVPLPKLQAQARERVYAMYTGGESQVIWDQLKKIAYAVRARHRCSFFILAVMRVLIVTSSEWHPLPDGIYPPNKPQALRLLHRLIYHLLLPFNPLDPTQCLTTLDLIDLELEISNTADWTNFRWIEWVRWLAGEEHREDVVGNGEKRGVLELLRGMKLVISHICMEENEMPWKSDKPYVPIELLAVSTGLTCICEPKGERIANMQERTRSVSSSDDDEAAEIDPGPVGALSLVDLMIRKIQRSLKTLPEDHHQSISAVNIAKHLGVARHRSDTVKPDLAPLRSMKRALSFQMEDRSDPDPGYNSTCELTGIPGGIVSALQHSFTCDGDGCGIFVQHEEPAKAQADILIWKDFLPMLERLKGESVEGNGDTLVWGRFCPGCMEAGKGTKDIPYGRRRHRLSWLLSDYSPPSARSMIDD